MTKSIIELVVGSLDEKRAYMDMMKRVNGLPKDYRYTFKKIQQYLYNFEDIGCDLSTFSDLIDLFETSAAEGKSVIDVLGSDVAAFCDELLKTAARTTTTKEQLNQEIQEYFHKGGK